MIKALALAFLFLLAAPATAQAPASHPSVTLDVSPCLSENNRENRGLADAELAGQFTCAVCAGRLYAHALLALDVSSPDIENLRGREFRTMNTFAVNAAPFSFSISAVQQGVSEDQVRWPDALPNVACMHNFGLAWEGTMDSLKDQSMSGLYLPSGTSSGAFNGQVEETVTAWQRSIPQPALIGEAYMGPKGPVDIVKNRPGWFTPSGVRICRSPNAVERGNVG